MRCTCGGTLTPKRGEVEFFGIDFGIRPTEVCNRCGSEYLSEELMEEIEAEVKKRGLFGLERKSRVSRSGNSLVIRIPKPIVDTLGLVRDTPVTVYPADHNRLILELQR